MFRLIELAAIGCIAYRLVKGYWPWGVLRSMTTMQRRRGRQLPREDAAWARALLGVGTDTPREGIIEAHKRLIMMVHPDKGGTGDLAREANAARDLLLGELASKEERRI